MDESVLEILRNMEMDIRDLKAKVDAIYQTMSGSTEIHTDMRYKEEVSKESSLQEARKYDWEMEMPLEEVMKKMGKALKP